jgi:hypothetical protein
MVLLIAATACHASKGLLDQDEAFSRSGNPDANMRER